MTWWLLLTAFVAVSSQNCGTDLNAPVRHLASSLTNHLTTNHTDASAFFRELERCEWACPSEEDWKNIGEGRPDRPSVLARALLARLRYWHRFLSASFLLETQLVWLQALLLTTTTHASLADWISWVATETVYRPTYTHACPFPGTIPVEPCDGLFCVVERDNG